MNRPIFKETCQFCGQEIKPRTGKPETVPEGKVVKYLTFGCGHILQGNQIALIARNVTDLFAAIKKNFGSCWCCTYNEPASEHLLLTVDLDNCDFNTDDWGQVLPFKTEMQIRDLSAANERIQGRLDAAVELIDKLVEFADTGSLGACYIQKMGKALCCGMESVDCKDCILSYLEGLRNE